MQRACGRYIDKNSYRIISLKVQTLILWFGGLNHLEIQLLVENSILNYLNKSDAYYHVLSKLRCQTYLTSEASVPNKIVKIQMGLIRTVLFWLP